MCSRTCATASPTPPPRGSTRRSSGSATPPAASATARTSRPRSTPTAGSSTSTHTKAGRTTVSSPCGGILFIDRREREPDDVRGLLARRLLDDRTFRAGREFSLVGVRARLEIGWKGGLRYRPFDEFVRVFAVLVVIEDLRRQKPLGFLPAVLVDHVAGLQIRGDAPP